MEYVIENTKPTPDEFLLLHSKVGWGATDIEMASASLNHSLFHVTARVGTKLIGMGRVIGDGSMFFYVQDVVVDPDFQNKGIGHSLMVQIEEYLSQVAKKGSTIGLFAAKGKEAFYARYNYDERNGTQLGYGMCKFV